LAVIVINLRILMGNTYSKLDEKINNTYLENLIDLTKESAATLSVHKVISEKSLNKTRGLLVDILNKSDISEYPLDWTSVSELPTISSQTTTPSDEFGGLGITTEQMTYIAPTGAGQLDPTDMQKINILNAIWKRINLIMIGMDSNINITRTFFMVEDTESTTKRQILTTIPGQEFEQTLTSEEFTDFVCFKNGTADNQTVYPIDLQTDPFYGGIAQTTGYCKGFTVGKFSGAVGVIYNVANVENLLLPLLDNSVIDKEMGE